MNIENSQKVNTVSVRANLNMTLESVNLTKEKGNIGSKVKNNMRNLEKQGLEFKMKQRKDTSNSFEENVQ